MQIQSPFVLSADSTASYRSFSDFFFASIADYGLRRAMVDNESGQQWNFAELQQATEKCVQRLREMGVKSNSSVALVCDTTSLSVVVTLAVSIIGARVACLNGFLSLDELWHQIDTSECSHCVVEAQFVMKIDEVRRKALMRGSNRIRAIRRVDEITGDVQLSRLQKRDSRLTMIAQQTKDPPVETSDSYAAVETSSVISGSTVVIRSRKEELEDEQSRFSTDSIDSSKPSPFIVLFPSGTTRFSKPVEISHQTVIHNLQRLRLSIYAPPNANDRFLLSVCLHHVFGWYSAYHALLNGAELITIQRPSNKVLLKALIEYKISYVHVTPHTIHFLANDLSLENVNLRSHLRSIITGGAPLDGRVARQCKERLGIRDIRQIYGMTELGGPCIFSSVGSDNLESVGQPMPGITLKILQFDTKRSCGPRQLGHLVVSGTNTSTNLQRSNKTNSESSTSDGFVKTGDVAFYDERGLIYVLDRVKDLIRYKGSILQVCPSEVESALRSHPGVEDCAVVARQDHVSGEVPAAFVVKRTSYAMLSTAEIRQHISGKIPQFKELRGGVFFVSEIPRSVSGKIVRQQLRQHWDRERSGSKVDALNGTANFSITPIVGSMGAKQGTRRSSVIIPASSQRPTRVTSANQRKFSTNLKKLSS